MALTKEQIFTVADKLAAGGQSPTLARVRATLGGGSFTTISEAMNEWRAKQQAKDAPPLREPTPETITRRLVGMGSDVWAVAMDLANSRLMTEREALDVARAEMEASKKEAAELADQMHAELEVAQARIADLETRLTAVQQAAEKRGQDMQTQLNQVQLENAELKARLEERDREIAERKANLSRLEAKFDQLQKDLLEIARAKSKPEPVVSTSVRPISGTGKKPSVTVKRPKTKKATGKAKKETIPVE